MLPIRSSRETSRTTDEDSAAEEGSSPGRIGRRALIKTTTATALAGGGFSASASAQSICPTDQNESEEPGARIVTPEPPTIVDGPVTVQIEAVDDQDDDADLAVELSIDGGDWVEVSHVDASGYFEHEWDVTDLSDGVYTLAARVTDSDGHVVESPSSTVVVNSETQAGIVEDFERDDPIAEYDGSVDAFDVQSNSVFDGERALVLDSGFTAGIAHTEGYNEEYLPTRGDEVHYYFRNAERGNFVSINHFAQSQWGRPDGYEIGFSGSIQSFVMWRVEDGEADTLDEAEFLRENQIEGWYRLEVRTDATSVAADLYDAHTDELLVELAAEDTAFVQGGIGFRGAGNGEIWDTVVVNPAEADGLELSAPPAPTATPVTESTTEADGATADDSTTDTESTTTAGDSPTGGEPTTDGDDTESPGEDAGGMPGFGVVGTVVSLVGVGYGALRFGAADDAEKRADE